MFVSSEIDQKCKKVVGVGWLVEALEKTGASPELVKLVPVLCVEPKLTTIGDDENHVSRTHVTANYQKS